LVETKREENLFRKLSKSLVLAEDKI
jgi:hypothetical protein